MIKTLSFNFFCGLSVFLSACLLFWLQPVISKSLTPVLGGSPMVWNSLLFFFQAMLLAGYAYAYGAAKYFPFKKFIIFHLVLAILVFFLFPSSLVPEDLNVNYDMAVLWLLFIALSSFGLPFFYLSTTAPLIQIWWARFYKKTNSEPYFLYAISNIGSFGALFSYLLFIERKSTLQIQFDAWSDLYVVFLALIFLIGLFILLFLKPQNNSQSPAVENIQKTKRSDKILWLLYAFAPASLLHGITVYITNDLFSLPLFWLLPLSLYLLTFVIAFSERAQKFYKTLYKILLPATFLPLIVTFWVDPPYSLPLLFMHIGLFFLLSLLCHYKLYRFRPADDVELGSFYLWLAVGGALAGFFNVIIAPLIFNSTFEYPLSVFLAFLLISSVSFKVKRPEWSFILKEIISPIFVSFLIILIYQNLEHTPFTGPIKNQDFAIKDLIVLLFISTVAITYIFYQKNKIFALALFSIFLFIANSSTINNTTLAFNLSPKQFLNNEKTVFIERNFFGIIRAIDKKTEHGIVRHYYNGTVKHAGQMLSQPVEHFAYNRKYPISFMFKKSRDMGLPIAMLGMGPAAMHCFADETQHIDYFEINPAVVKMAENKDIFTFISNCPASYETIIGDARLQLEKQPDEKYGAIINSIYWSNTVPFHILTKEAMEIYLRKLAPGGYLRLVVPKHYFNFIPLFAAYSDYFNIPIYTIENEYNIYTREFFLQKPSFESDIPKNWIKIDSAIKAPLWTDDYYSIFDLFNRSLVF